MALYPCEKCKKPTRSHKLPTQTAAILTTPFGPIPFIYPERYLCHGCWLDEQAAKASAA